MGDILVFRYEWIILNQYWRFWTSQPNFEPMGDQVMTNT